MIHIPKNTKQGGEGNGPILLVLNTTEGFLQIVAGRMPVTSSCPAMPDDSCMAKDEAALASISANPLFTSLNSLQQIPVFPTGSTLLCAQHWHILSQGTELLAPALHEIAARLKISITDITHLACVTGPGSFTGIRLATSTAAGLSRATGALQGGVPYLPLLAINAVRLAPWLFFDTGHQDTQSPFLWVMTHARRDLVHLQGFTVIFHDKNTNESMALSTPQDCAVALASDLLVLSSEEAAATILAIKRPAIILGSGVQKNAKAFATFFADSDQYTPLVLPSAFSIPTAATLLDIAATALFTTSDLAPTHIRPCDAEDNLDHIAGLLHLDPQKAREALFTQMHRGLQTEK